MADNQINKKKYDYKPLEARPEDIPVQEPVEGANSADIELVVRKEGRKVKPQEEIFVVMGDGKPKNWRNPEPKDSNELTIPHEPTDESMRAAGFTPLEAVAEDHTHDRLVRGSFTYQIDENGKFVLRKKAAQIAARTTDQSFGLLAEQSAPDEVKILKFSGGLTEWTPEEEVEEGYQRLFDVAGAIVIMISQYTRKCRDTLDIDEIMRDGKTEAEQPKENWLIFSQNIVPRWQPNLLVPRGFKFNELGVTIVSLATRVTDPTFRIEEQLQYSFPATGTTGQMWTAFKPNHGFKVEQFLAWDITTAALELFDPGNPNRNRLYGMVLEILDDTNFNVLIGAITPTPQVPVQIGLDHPTGTMLYATAGGGYTTTRPTSGDIHVIGQVIDSGYIHFAPVTIYDQVAITPEPKNLYSGIGVPSDNIGTDGDYYQQLDTKLGEFEIWGAKANGKWPPAAAYHKTPDLLGRVSGVESRLDNLWLSYATQAWVNSQMADLTGSVTYMEGEFPSFAKKGDLSAYAKTVDLVAETKLRSDGDTALDGRVKTLEAVRAAKADTALGVAFANAADYRVPDSGDTALTGSNYEFYVPARETAMLSIEFEYHRPNDTHVDYFKLDISFLKAMIGASTANNGWGWRQNGAVNEIINYIYGGWAFYFRYNFEADGRTYFLMRTSGHNGTYRNIVCRYDSSPLRKLTDAEAQNLTSTTAGVIDGATLNRAISNRNPSSVDLNASLAPYLKSADAASAYAPKTETEAKDTAQDAAIAALQAKDRTLETEITSLTQTLASSGGDLNDQLASINYNLGNLADTKASKTELSNAIAAIPVADLSEYATHDQLVTVDQNTNRRLNYLESHQLAIKAISVAWGEVLDIAVSMPNDGIYQISTSGIAPVALGDVFWGIGNPPVGATVFRDGVAGSFSNALFSVWGAQSAICIREGSKFTLLTTGFVDYQNLRWSVNTTVTDVFPGTGERNQDIKPSRWMVLKEGSIQWEQKTDGVTFQAALQSWNLGAGTGGQITGITFDGVAATLTNAIPVGHYVASWRSGVLHMQPLSKGFVPNLTNFTSAGGNTGIGIMVPYRPGANLSSIEFNLRDRRADLYNTRNTRIVMPVSYFQDSTNNGWTYWRDGNNDVMWQDFNLAGATYRIHVYYQMRPQGIRFYFMDSHSNTVNGYGYISDFVGKFV
jgi:hypothetical protein